MKGKIIEVPGIRTNEPIETQNFFDEFDKEHPFFHSLMDQTSKIIASVREDQKLWVIDFMSKELECLFYVKIPLCDEEKFNKYIKPLNDYFLMLKKTNLDD